MNALPPLRINAKHGIPIPWYSLSACRPTELNRASSTGLISADESKPSSPSRISKVVRTSSTVLTTAGASTHQPPPITNHEQINPTHTPLKKLLASLLVRLTPTSVISQEDRKGFSSVSLNPSIVQVLDAAPHTRLSLPKKHQKTQRNYTSTPNTQTEE